MSDSTNKAQASFKKYISKSQEELELFKKDLQEQEVCHDPPELDSDKVVNALLHANIRIESELETIIEKDVQFLPNDKNLLLNLNKEKAENTSLQLTRTLKHQQLINSNLEDEKMRLTKCLEDAKLVEEKLNSLMKDENEINYMQLLDQKYRTYGTFFTELRDELASCIESNFDEEQREIVQDTLQSLINQLFNDPNDPYLSFNDIDDSVMNTLVNAAIVSRDPTRHTFYKANDFTSH